MCQINPAERAERPGRLQHRGILRNDGRPGFFRFVSERPGKLRFWSAEEVHETLIRQD